MNQEDLNKEFMRDEEDPVYLLKISADILKLILRNESIGILVSNQYPRKYKIWGNMGLNYIGKRIPEDLNCAGIWKFEVHKIFSEVEFPFNWITMFLYDDRLEIPIIDEDIVVLTLPVEAMIKVEN